MVMMMRVGPLYLFEALILYTLIELLFIVL